MEGLVPLWAGGLGTSERPCNTLAANLDNHVALRGGNVLTSLNWMDG